MRSWLNVSGLPGFLLIALVAGGCAPRARVPLPPAPPGMERVLLERLEESAENFQSLQGIAKVRVSAGGKTVSGNQVLFARKPDRFRTEVLSPFGSPMLTAATEGSRLTVLVPGEGRFYSGEASYRNLQRFTRLPLQLEDLVHLLLYEVPIVPGAEPILAAVAEGYLLTLASSGGVRQDLLFDARSRLTRAAWYRDDALQLQVEYGSFTDGELPFPRAISLLVPSREVEASLNFSELDLNREIPPDRFLLKPPAGYAVEPLP